jgi:hypothetical protein
MRGPRDVARVETGESTFSVTLQYFAPSYKKSRVAMRLPP